LIGSLFYLKLKITTKTYSIRIYHVTGTFLLTATGISTGQY